MTDQNNNHFDFSTLVIEPLNNKHDTLDFNCNAEHQENKDLNDFIKNDALNERYELWNKTYMNTHKGHNKVIAFFTISTDSFRIKHEIQKEGAKYYQQIPAIKIGRVAIHKEYQNKDLGKSLIDYASL